MSNHLEDVGLRSGIRRTKLHKTAMNHFNKFLVHCEDYPFNDFIEMEEFHCTTEIIGKFSSYISQHIHSIKMWSTHKNYVSAVHVEFMTKFKNLDFTSYMTTLYDNIRKEYQEKDQPLVNHTLQMKVKERDYICRRLFVESKHEMRAIVADDWVACGRMSEVMYTLYKLYSIHYV